MDTIQEALRELARMDVSEHNKAKIKHSKKSLREAIGKKRRKVRAFEDLWDQVYCSLTDGGADSAYQALGDLNGAGPEGYDIYQISLDNSKPGFDTIIVRSNRSAYAVKVAKAYGLDYEIIPRKGIYIYIPEDAPIRTDLIHKVSDNMEIDTDSDYETDLDEKKNLKARYQ